MLVFSADGNAIASIPVAGVEVQLTVVELLMSVLLPVNAVEAGSIQSTGLERV